MYENKIFYSHAIIFVSITNMKFPVIRVEMYCGPSNTVRFLQRSFHI